MSAWTIAVLRSGESECYVFANRLTKSAWEVRQAGVARVVTVKRVLFRGFPGEKITVLEDPA